MKPFKTPTTHGYLIQSWQRAWRNLNLPAPAGLFERLLAAYNEPHRHYHTQQHLVECLEHFDAALAFASEPGEVEIALWFHDAIYILRGADNELHSADWAMQELAASGATTQVQARVHNLIMTTLHNAIPSDADQQLLVDIDLAILGAAPARFSEYDRQVRAEYSWVPGLLYRIKRKAVLKHFLTRDHLYNTSHFRNQYEQQAKANLQTAIG
ncbi:HD domain-containing protein [Pseudomonas anguilliseptica]|uniref:HD domain-containing protein n=1 Tax=Pseudomonas anguilliseptica TaxID=53406 RepID=UPI00325B0EFB